MVELAIWLVAALVVGIFIVWLGGMLIGIFAGRDYGKLGKQLSKIATEPASKSELEDDLYRQAVEYVKTLREVSAVDLQSQLSVGFAKAARLLEVLEQQGIVEGAVGAKKRKVKA